MQCSVNCDMLFQENNPGNNDSSLPSCNFLNMYYQNVRGLNTKTHEFFNASSSSQYRLIALTETWLHEELKSTELFNDNFIVFRSDRNFSATNTKRGGGVLIAINKELSAVELNLSRICCEIQKIDIVGVKIAVKHQIIFIFVVYIPPGLNQDYYNKLFDVLQGLDYLNGHNVYFVGDFNIPEYNQNNVSTGTLISLKSFCSYFEFEQYNNVTNSKNRILDLVFSDKYCAVIKSCDVLLAEDEHHPSLDIEISVDKPNDDRSFAKCAKRKFNFRKADFNNLYRAINFKNWDFLNTYTDVNEACEVFYQSIYEVLELYVPKTIPSSGKYPPWFSHSIIKDLKRKYHLLKKYRNTLDDSVFNEFKHIRSKIKKDIEHSYNNYLNTIEDNIKHDVKSFWSYVNSKKGTSTIPTTMEFNGDTFENPQDIVNNFAAFFKDSFNLPSDASSTTSLSNTTTLYVKCFAEEEIIVALKKLKPKLTRGPDDIPAFVVRDCAYVLAKPLTILFNLSLKTGVYPSLWKVSRICPVHKKGSKNNIENYRPITIICNFAKVFEIALHRDVYAHVQGQITPMQHGFMCGRSTTTNLFCITQYIAQNVDMNLQVDVLYLDFSKAFDRLDHCILIQKLNSAGLSTPLVTFFKSYLSNRKQYVEYDGFKSFEISVTSGVPQGSVLGPLLFNIFINDIVDNLNVNVLLYADDAKLYSHIKTIEDCIKLQQAVTKINAWCDTNGLSLNISKCVVVTYTRKQSPILFDYKLGGVPFSRSDNIKDLGITFDSELNFNKHVENVVISSYKNLGFIIRNTKGFNDTKVLITLYNSLIRSRLEYSSIIWQSGYNIYNNNLENVQRRFLKYVSFRMDGVYPAVGVPEQQLLERFSFLSLKDRRKQHSLVFLFKIVNNQLDCSDILNQINFHIPRLEARNTLMFYLPTPRTNLLKFSPLYLMCENYNSLQNSLDIFNCKISTIKKCF